LTFFHRQKLRKGPARFQQRRNKNINTRNKGIEAKDARKLVGASQWGGGGTASQLRILSSTLSQVHEQLEMNFGGKSTYNALAWVPKHPRVPVPCYGELNSGDTRRVSRALCYGQRVIVSWLSSLGSAQ